MRLHANGDVIGRAVTRGRYRSIAAASAVNAFCKTQQLTFAGIRLGYDCVMDDALFVSRRH